MKSSVPPLPSATGGSDGSSSKTNAPGKNSAPQTKKNNKSRGESKEDGGGANPAVKSTSTDPAGKNATVPDSKSEGPGESGGVDEDAKTTTPSTAAAASTGETALMSEVAGLLRSLRMQEQGPALRVCQLRRVGADQQVNVLLDGGATHCLRQSRSVSEWEESKEVKVSLAQGEVVLRQHPADSGTNSANHSTFEDH